MDLRRGAKSAALASIPWRSEDILAPKGKEF
jgi:hypothetical protein